MSDLGLTLDGIVLNVNYEMLTCGFSSSGLASVVRMGRGGGGEEGGERGKEGGERGKEEGGRGNKCLSDRAN